MLRRNGGSSFYTQTGININLVFDIMVESFERKPRMCSDSNILVTRFFTDFQLLMSELQLMSLYFCEL